MQKNKTAKNKFPPMNSNQNTMKHTKGKWEVAKSGNEYFDICVVAEDGGSVCHVSRWPEAPANAQLIAAAPELLENLEKAKSIIYNWYIIPMIGKMTGKEIMKDWEGYCENAPEMKIFKSAQK